MTGLQKREKGCAQCRRRSKAAVEELRAMMMMMMMATMHQVHRTTCPGAAALLKRDDMGSRVPH
jgi:hypothetical protein